MAITTYTIKRGDTLWGIAVRYASSIEGKDTVAKVNTLGRLNNMKDPWKDYIYAGQVIKLSGTASGTTGSTESKAEPTVPIKATIDGFGLIANDETGRAMYASWSWKRDNTKNYKYRWLQHLNGKWVVGSEGETTSYEDIYCQSTWSADENATKVRFQVLPQSATYKSNNEDVPYWTDAKWSDVKEYDFSNNPPLTPGVPTVEITDKTLTASINNIDAKKLDAKYVKFNIVKDNKSSVHTSPNVTINTTSNYVSYQFQVDFGSEYKVRACCVGANGKESGWSEFSTNAGTRPSAPKSITVYRRNKRSDGSISAYLEWEAVPNATAYRVEYTTIREDFENASGNIQRADTDDARTSIEIVNIESGQDYFFRVRALNDVEDGVSDPTDIVTIPIGEPPAAPTTWSSSNSAFVGESMELSWAHNARDGSRQSFAQLSIKVNDGSWFTFTFENSTNETTPEEDKVVETFTYGQVISNKGEMHVLLDTSNLLFKNAKVLWKVRTAGITDAFSDTDWSVERTIYIYEEPILALSVTNDLAGLVMLDELTTFPFYIRGEVELDSYELQKPIGYHLRVVANEFYETVDNSGKKKTINPGDSVYSKYFDTTEILIVEMSAFNIDLESGIKYTVRCSADMSTGLSVEQSYDFTVNWTDISYTMNANINVSEETFTAAINPYCEDADGNLVENVTLSVYRREYDGSLVEIASGIPNNGTSVTDPHPALDYARYRLVARDTNTGAVSFYDMPGHRIGCPFVVLQWAEEWQQFDLSDVNPVEAPPWTGSMLILKYNVSVTDGRKRTVSVVEYAGREHPVPYYGKFISDSSTWTTVIPKTDVDTIYALRRLSIWAGSVYVREPSGMGFWATVNPKFNINYDSLTIPVTLEITRVEGGV